MNLGLKYSVSYHSHCFLRLLVSRVDRNVFLSIIVHWYTSISYNLCLEVVRTKVPFEPSETK